MTKKKLLKIHIIIVYTYDVCIDDRVGRSEYAAE